MNTLPNNMMSGTNDERMAVTELQSMLRYISRYNENILPVVPDGVFGENTEAAVKDFQKLEGLEENGVVDHETWEKVRQVFNELKNTHLPANPVYIYPPELISLSSDNDFDEVLILQVMLKRLSDRYSNVPNVEITGVYDPKTKETVVKLQEIFRIDQSGEVDKQTWNKINSLYSALTYND